MRRLVLLSVLLTLGLQYGFAQDWANLHKFKNDNMKIENKNNRVVFMGNSITEAWQTVHPEFFKENSFVNRGISGQTTPQMLLRFRQDVIELKPELVVILAGINDIAENTGPITLDEILNNIISMTELARANQIEVLLCTVLPANRFQWRPSIKPADKVIELNGKLADYAQRANLIFVNYYDAMVDDQKGLRKEFGEDGVHPNKKGYDVMETVLQKELSQVLE
ncbi:GDSL-type esterase/lipase family protein [Namhaeicola litoreus]|uniref:GDSL-type esterase/lipase family protein n=1 Tax=Namhaeicola litoreus TaxID=1052145 RepID=A0ABW3Y2H3_9FLAO